MADIKGTHSPEQPTRQVTDFPEVKGKIIDSVEISASMVHYAITIRFPDKTSLCFTVQPCVAVFPTYSNWATGDEKPLKRWKPVRSMLPNLEKL